MERKRALGVAAIVISITLAGCGGTPDRGKAKVAEDLPIGVKVDISPPLGLPPVPIPASNVPTAETISLGRRLFYETKLSVDDTLSCASCHNPAMGFGDGRKHSTGVGGKLGTRNAPTVLNAAYAPLQFWDGRAPSLEEQSAGPILNPVEMNQSHEVCVSKLDALPAYRAAFERAFGPGPVTIGKIKNAIASFERTLLSGNSAFDRYQYQGDKKALSPAAVRGFTVFKDARKGNCVVCHTIDNGFALFSDGKFHNLGVGVNDEGELTDLGRFTETKVEADKGAFKTSTLRNIAKTAPYMHDGSVRTLRDVVDFYAGKGNSNPYLDPEIKKIELSGQERADLVAFLESLTGDTPANSGPPASGESK